jgi:branched-chain amino acid transport system substrate-binding protein
MGKTSKSAARKARLNQEVMLMRSRKRITRRDFLKTVGAGGVAAVGGLSLPRISWSQTKEPIKIGFIQPLTGPFGTEARDQEAGATLAVEEVNARGGVLGRKIELLVRDDKLQPEESARRAKELLEKDKIHMMAGSIGAHTQLAMNEQCKRAQTIFMSTSASNEITMAKDVSPYTFSEATNLHIITQAVGSWTAQQLGKKWFILAANYGFGWQTTEGFRRIGKQFGCTELGLINHPTGATDYTTYFPKILAANPEVLLMCNFGKDQLNSIKQAHEFGLKKKMKIVAPLLVITSRMAAGDEPYEDVIGGATFYWGLEKMIPTSKTFVTHYRKKWARPPTDMSAYAYSGVRGLLSAVERAGAMDTKKVVLALEGYEYDHYKGKQWMRAWDHRSIQDMFVLQSKSGKEKTEEWDVFKIVDTVKAHDGMERPAEELGLKAGVPLSQQLQ